MGRLAVIVAAAALAPRAAATAICDGLGNTAIQARVERALCSSVTQRFVNVTAAECQDAVELFWAVAEKEEHCPNATLPENIAKKLAEEVLCDELEHEDPQKDHIVQEICEEETSFLKKRACELAVSTLWGVKERRCKKPADLLADPSKLICEGLNSTAIEAKVEQKVCSVVTQRSANVTLQECQDAVQLFYALAETSAHCPGATPPGDVAKKLAEEVLCDELEHEDPQKDHIVQEICEEETGFLKKRACEMAVKTLWGVKERRCKKQDTILV